MSPIWACGCDVENTCHFLVYNSNFLDERNTLLKKITNIDSSVLHEADSAVPKKLLFDNSKYSDEVNFKILLASIVLILRSKRFDESLFIS